MKPAESYEAEFQRIDREMAIVEWLMVALIVVIMCAVTAWWVLK